MDVLCRRLFVSEEIEGVRRLHELIKHSVFNHVTNCFTLAKVGGHVPCLSLLFVLLVLILLKRQTTVCSHPLCVIM